MSNEKLVAEDIIEKSEGLDSFWFSTHSKKENAEKKANLCKKVLSNTGASASYELDSNYGGRGYGVTISGFSDNAEKLLQKKYKI